MDYWALDAYPEDCPLSYTPQTFLTCRNRDRIRFCLFLVTGSAYGRFADDEAFQTYSIRMITQPNYLKVERNRPVIYMGFLNDALVNKLLDGRWQRFCGELARHGLGNQGHRDDVASQRRHRDGNPSRQWARDSCGRPRQPHPNAARGRNRCRADLQVRPNMRAPCAHLTE